MAGCFTWGTLRVARHFLLAAPLLLAAPARAQRADGGPPAADPFQHPPAPEVPGGQYVSHSYREGVLTIRATDGSTRQVQPWATGVVKISYFAPGRRPVADSSVSVVQPPLPYDPNQPATAGISLNETEAKIFNRTWHQPAAWGEPHTRPLRRSEAVVATAQAVHLLYDDNLITLDKKTLTISITQRDYYRPYPLFSEAAPAYRRRPATPPAPDAPPLRIDELAGTGVRFRLQPGERLYGTGARALPLDRRGHRLELYNQAHYGYGNGEPALNVTLPVVLSSRGYLLLFDHYAAAYLDLGKKNPGALEYGVEGLSSLSYFVITGHNQAEILNCYTALTGRQPLPPRWALGLIQSRFGYRSQAEMLRVASQMRRRNFPLDALVLDLFWFGGTTRQGDFSWDAAHFPDPAGLMRELKMQGINTVLISEPYVMRTSRNDSLVRTRGLVGTTAAGQPYTVGSFWAGPASILDVFKPQARTWLWAQYQRLHDQGAAGWWSDLGEPENHPEAMHHALGPTRQVHNAYGITWAQLFQDNYAKSYPHERLFNLARSGWAGMQRNSVFPWSGDVSRTWSGLQAQVPIMLSMGQAGVGYMHSDAGGFGANATQDPELYTRWLQLAALCPVMRPHSDEVVPPEPYTYPEPYQSIVRDYAHLRARLLPYLYTLAAENTLTGAPLTRALDYFAHGASGHRTMPISALNQLSDSADITKPYYQWSQPPQRPAKSLFVPRTEEEKYGASPPNDQYLLGSELLVAPVSQPGQRRRNVVLPSSVGGWLDFETGQALPGGQTVGLPAPLHHLPLLVRAGAVVPMAAYRSSTAAFRPDTLVLRYFPAPQAGGRRFTVYEDDGRSAQALSQRQFVSFSIKTETGVWDGGVGSLTIRQNGAYQAQPASRWVQLEVMRVAGAPKAVLLGEQPLAATAWQFDAARHALLVRAPLHQVTTLAFPGLRLLAQPVAQLYPETLALTAPDSRTFADSATVRYLRYSLASQPETLRIRDQCGRVVRELPTLAAPGPHALRWDGRDAQGHPVPAGLYVAELAGQHQVLRRLP